MPSTTFLNLPEEKKNRLIDAAWKELANVSFDKISINRIIHTAMISRGSFYQYFEDKQDMLHFLLYDMKKNFWKIAMEDQQIRQGDLFERSLKGYDWIMDRWKQRDPRMCQLVRLAQLNPAIDVDPSKFDGGYERWGRKYGDNAFWEEDGIVWTDHIGLLSTIWSEAVLQSFRQPEEIERIRIRLKKYLKILKRGMLVDAAEETMKA